MKQYTVKPHNKKFQGTRKFHQLLKDFCYCHKRKKNLTFVTGEFLLLLGPFQQSIGLPVYKKNAKRGGEINTGNRASVFWVKGYQVKRSKPERDRGEEWGIGKQLRKKEKNKYGIEKGKERAWKTRMRIGRQLNKRKKNMEKRKIGRQL